jgi:ribosome-binding factor A
MGVSSNVPLVLPDKEKGMENRGQKYHRGRMAEALREEVTALVEGELGDPRIGLVSVVEVQLGEDGRTARVFISAAGNEEEAEQSLAGLKAAGGYIRHELVSRLGIRQAPEIIFVLDESQEHGGRIEELLHRIQKRKR